MYCIMHLFLFIICEEKSSGHFDSITEKPLAHARQGTMEMQVDDNLKKAGHEWPATGL